jgi:IclR family KDG regulon transcriptional repressor
MTEVGPDGHETLRTADAALAVLEHLAGSQRPQGLAEISRSLGISKPKALRILRTLRARGYATQEETTARYRFGLACARLVAQARAEVSVALLCAPALRWLWETTQETTYLAALEAGRGVVIEKLDSPRPVIATSSLGRTLPLHAVSAGKALLAGLSDREVTQLFSAGLTAYTDATPGGLDALLEEVRQIRRQGYAVNREGYRDGVSGVAAPIRWAPDGPTALAIAVCVPALRFGRAAGFLRSSVVEAAARASRALEAAAGGQLVVAR